MRTFTRSIALAAIAASATTAAAQDSSALSRARSAARAASPDIAAAAAAADAARARARQAGAFVNPALTYAREQTSGSGLSTSQDIISLDQIIENPGLRGARRDAARLHANITDARRRAVEIQLDHDVARAYAQAIAAARRATLADETARAFATAAAVSERRLQEGDISGHAARRIRLESARYAALKAEATFARSTANIGLVTLTGRAADTSALVDVPIMPGVVVLAADSLVALALRSRPEIVAAALEIEVAVVETRQAARERLPSATLSFGPKSEQATGGERLNGFMAAVSLPLPLWDRRAAAVAAASAETLRREAELVAMKRRVTREVLEAAEALRAARDQLAALSPALQSDAAAALRSAQVAYAEGELTLLEWLDTVRAYYETETSIANLRAELVVRVAALERAVGTTVIQEIR